MGRGVTTFFSLLLVCIPAFAIEEQPQFDVVIAGGSTAAFATAISAAQDGARVALLEPTDWIGGQITSSGVPAIDEAWHKIKDSDGGVTMDVAKIARTPANISPLLREMLSETGCPGKCWVSRFCFEPKVFLEQQLMPLESSQERLTVFRETVLAKATSEGDRITAVTAIQRTARRSDSSSAYDVLPSRDIVDWYSPENSDRFLKRVLRFAGTNTVFIDATEWGELLALSGAPYLIGVEHTDGALEGDASFGQSVTYGFVQELHADADANRDATVPAPEIGNLGFGDYRDRKNAWEQVWTYRRLRAAKREVSTGDLSLQNWGYYVDQNEGGNDYPFGYLFLDKAATKKQIEDGWVGGVDRKVMAAAEERAFAWHHWLKSQAPKRVNEERVSLSKNVLGTAHGLSKLPYIRDTRRSIGHDRFLLNVKDLQPTGDGLARTFADRIALGAYPVDIHPLANREYPDYVNKQYDIAPFTIPFRALTNDRYDNLLVAGKTMAQSFLANSATRLHPTEWSTGTAAGVAAAMMAKEAVGSRDVARRVTDLQKRVRAKTPIDWTVVD